jgi:uncharacterized protein (UPF0261 family)
MMYSVTDILGLNRVTERILSNAAGAIVGMVAKAQPISMKGKPVIGATMLGSTTPCVMKAKSLLEEKGYELIPFHTTGVGGKTFEEFTEQGLFAGVLDLTLHELVQSGAKNAGPDRLETAGRKAVPQVVAPGGLDIVFVQKDNVPSKYSGKKIYDWVLDRAWVRATAEDMASAAQVVAEKLNKSVGPTAIMIPRRGFSDHDIEGGLMFDPAADLAFAQTLKKHLNGNVELLELDAHINDPVFAETAVIRLLDMMKRR